MASHAPEGPIREEEALGKAYDARLMRRLLSYLSPYRLQVAGAVLMLIAASGLELVGPWLTKIALDRAVPATDIDLLGTLAAVFVGSLLAAAALEYLRTLLTTWIGQKVMLDIRGEVFSRLQRLELAFFDRNPVGRLMTRVTSDVEVLNEMFTSGVVTIFGDIFTIGAIVTAMLLLDWRLALVSFAVLPVVFLAAVIFRRKVRSAYRDIRTRLARINAFLQERITGIGVVKLFGQERATAGRFGRINESHLQAHLKSITYYALFFPVIEILTAVAVALILWYGGLRALEGTISIGVIAAFLQYVRRFFRPIQDLSEKYNILQNAMASSERVFRLLDRVPAIEEAENPIDPGEIEGRIEFRNVWFRYPGPESDEVRSDDDDWVLRNISFVVEPGERMAIVGATGAGKSTIVNLLLRFYDPQRGEILLDGIDIRELSLETLRGSMGLVLQDVYLFSASAAENISLGRPSIEDASIVEAADRVGADPYVRRLPGGYEQALGERGSSLSVGERQLLSFARALAGAPRILLLDEATSSVDSEIEAQIDIALEALMRGRTSLVIAHRLSTVQNADRILVLHHGEIRETGTHEELLEVEEGLYARLYRLQFASTEAA
ncbi:MAG: ABC transporter ATP-binding protein/permease [marine benthic group bacterium]|nr:ABC transporter ATP-binding protein/permease [Gemmatimonadota bacterium]MCL7956455.1 ABC transporter ATP-binding protein/permease [Gemmatimonadota bacterium]MCL7964170.1 ABC transporter ATP-binding protein/permease [Gemmatimonadota bacterium]MCL7979103.1 ABC transporter ATP-binding protein/permease [Gemmatimonadota bacterium]